MVSSMPPRQSSIHEARGAEPLNSLFSGVAIGQPGLAENERRVVLSDRIQIFVALDFAFGRAVEIQFGQGRRASGNLPRYRPPHEPPRLWQQDRPPRHIVRQRSRRSAGRRSVRPPHRTRISTAQLRLQGQNPKRCRSTTWRASGDRRHGQPSCRLAINATDAIATMAAPAKPATEISDELRARNGVSTVRYISSASAIARAKTHSFMPTACAAITKDIGRVHDQRPVHEIERVGDQPDPHRQWIGQQASERVRRACPDQAGGTQTGNQRVHSWKSRGAVK